MNQQFNSLKQMVGKRFKRVDKALEKVLCFISNEKAPSKF